MTSWDEWLERGAEEERAEKETHSVTVTQRVDVEESKDFITLKEFHRGNLTCGRVSQCLDGSLYEDDNVYP